MIDDRLGSGMVEHWAPLHSAEFQAVRDKGTVAPGGIGIHAAGIHAAGIHAAGIHAAIAWIHAVVGIHAACRGS